MAALAALAVPNREATAAALLKQLQLLEALLERTAQGGSTHPQFSRLLSLLRSYSVVPLSGENLQCEVHSVCCEYTATE